MSKQMEWIQFLATIFKNYLKINKKKKKTTSNVRIQNTLIPECYANEHKKLGDAAFGSMSTTCKIEMNIHETWALSDANLQSSNTLEILLIRLLLPDPFGPTNIRDVVSGTL